MEKRAKSNQQNKQIKREFSAGGVVFKKLQTLWLVAKSSPSDLYPESYWRLQKGWLDDEGGGKKPGPLGRGERKATENQLQEAALREVEEEGGVKAKVIKKLETQRIFYTLKGERILKFVTYYLMEWQEDLPRGTSFETEEVAWLPYKDARKKLKHSGEKKILDKAKEVLESGVQESLV